MNVGSNYRLTFFCTYRAEKAIASAVVTMELDPTANKAAEEEENSEAQAKELPYLFEKELIEKQTKKIYILEDYAPDAVGRNVHPVDFKFYARHDQQRNALLKEDTKRFHKYTELGRRTTQLGLPLLESQVYGWMPPKTTSRLSELNFITAPKLRCDMTIYGEKFINSRITERTPFYGLRFFVR